MKKIKEFLPKNSFEKKDRIKQLEAPKKKVSFDEWKKTINDNFPELLFPAEIGLAIMTQILITDVTNPFALVLVDVPAAGKTIVINFFDGIDELTYATDKFTPASFVSNSASIKREDIAKVDLLPRLRYKMFLLRDMSTVFSKKEEHLKEELGLLTRVLDGEGLSTESGIHGHRGYNGEYLFMMLAASTPISPKIFKIMGNLGSRLFFLKMNSRDKSDNELADQLQNTAYKEKEHLCRHATSDFLHTLWSENPNGIVWDKSKDPIEVLTIISRCARMLAHLRGAINVYAEDSWGDTKYNYSSPTIEKPDRINQLLYNLARGRALVNGRKQIDMSDMKPIIELCFDSGYTTRSTLFRAIIEHNGTLKTSEIETILNCAKPTALKEMETLKILKVCNLVGESDGFAGAPEKEIKLSKIFAWFLSDECKILRGTLTPPPEQQKLPE